MISSIRSPFQGRPSKAVAYRTKYGQMLLGSAIFLLCRSKGSGDAPRSALSASVRSGGWNPIIIRYRFTELHHKPEDENMNPEMIQKMKDEASESMKETLDELRRDEPKVVDAAAAAVGSTLGAGASYTALFFSGKVVGVSGPGILSGLKAAGALVGGKAVAGIGVLVCWRINKLKNIWMVA